MTYTEATAGLANPYVDGTTDHHIWELGANAALTAVQVAGESGGDWLTNIVMDAQEILGMVDDEDLL